MKTFFSQARLECQSSADSEVDRQRPLIKLDDSAAAPPCSEASEQLISLRMGARRLVPAKEIGNAHTITSSKTDSGHGSLSNFSQRGS